MMFGIFAMLLLLVLDRWVTEMRHAPTPPDVHTRKLVCGIFEALVIFLYLGIGRLNRMYPCKPRTGLSSLQQTQNERLVYETTHTQSVTVEFRVHDANPLPLGAAAAVTQAEGFGTDRRAASGREGVAGREAAP
jgi:hypothetical protein